MSDSPTRGPQADGTPAPSPSLGDATTRAGDTDSGRTGPYVPGATDRTPPPAIAGYQIVGELGHGGMGVVYRAVHVKLHRPAALKMVLGDARAESKVIIRFLAEAEAVAAVKHPHVVGVYDYGDADGRPFLALELCPGGSLADKLKAGRLAPREAAELVRKVASGVAAAHALGIVHRDLKPHNVLFDDLVEPKVTDFGLAKRGGGADLTHTGAVMGTPAYMSPEQAKGDTKFVGPGADVWALGVILYECLTGQRPFAADDPWAILQKVMNEEPAGVRAISRAVPRDLDLICRKCLAKEPHERYPSAAALADDLARFAAGEPVGVRAAGVLERAYKWARRKPAVAGLYAAAVAGLVLVAMVATVAWLWRGTEAARGTAVAALAGEAAARATAEEERGRAVTARDALAVAQDKLAWAEYGRTIQVAYQAWRDGDVATARSLLASTREDFRGWEWRYVHRLCHADRLTLKGHRGTVQAATFSPDGTRVATGGYDGAVKVWDAKSGAVFLTLQLPSLTSPGLKGGQNHVKSLAFSPDGARLAVGGWDGARVCDAKTGAVLLHLPMADGRAWPAAFSPDGAKVVTGGPDNQVTVWDAKTGDEDVTLVGHTDQVRSASYSPDGARIVTCGDRTVRVWDAKTGVQWLTIRGRDTTVGGVRNGWSAADASFSPDGTKVLTVGSLEVNVWDARNGAERLSIRHPRGFRAARFGPDGTKIVTGGVDLAAKVWDAGSGAELFTLKGHTAGQAGGTSAINSVSFSPDGSQLLTAGADGTARLWAAAGGAEGFTLIGHGLYVDSAAYSPDGSLIVTSSGDGTARVWDADTGAERRVLKGHGHSVSTVAFTPDGRRILTGSYDQTAKLWDTNTGAVLLTLREQGTRQGMRLCAGLSPDGKRALTYAQSKSVKVWDVTTGTELFALEVGMQSYCPPFSPDGSCLATSRFGETTVWDATTGGVRLSLKETAQLVQSVSFSADGSVLATGARGGGVKLWDLKTGSQLLALQHGDATAGAARTTFSPDGTRVVTRADATAKIWDARTGSEHATLFGHTSPISSVSFSPDGSRLATGGSDGSARVWDPKTGAELLTLRWDVGEVTSAAFSPDGSQLLTVGYNRPRVWDARPLNREIRPEADLRPQAN